MQVKSWIKARLSFLFRHSWVLMYHRIADPDFDPWNLAVKPEIFEEQLAWLRRHRTILSVEDMVARFRNGNLGKHAVSLSFDDGYLDNYITALPLLERYEIPATFFICTETVLQQTPYWWDEFDQIVLFDNGNGEHQLSVNGSDFAFNFDQQENDAQLRQWRYPHAPPNEKGRTYMRLWEQLRKLRHDERVTLLQQWKQQICTSPPKTPAVINLQQLKTIAQHPLISIGAHTARHPALQYLDREMQKEEIQSNKQWLEDVCNQPVNLLAYPHGSYNDHTFSIANELGFTAAFATHSNPLKRSTHLFNIGRFMVTNETQFKRAL